MAKNNDPNQQAADFLRVWQEQMTRQMTNPDTIHAMLSALSAFNPRGTNDASPRRPAPSPHADDDAIAALAERLDTMERELVELRKSVHAKAKNSTGTGRGSVAKRQPKLKRTMVKRVAKPKRPVRAAKPKAKQAKRKR